MPVKPLKKSAKNENNKGIVNMENFDRNAKSFIEKFLGDVSKTSASKQIFFGVASGWLSGFMSMRIGKTVAIAIGGGIILLQIANEKGYLKVNWSKVNKKLDKVADEVGEKITGEGPSWMNKVERYVDRKLDKAEDTLKNQQKKTKRWYSSLTGNSNCNLQEIHIFLVSFCAGVAIGIATS